MQTRWRRSNYLISYGNHSRACSIEINYVAVQV